MKMVSNTVNQAEKGTVIYSANEQVETIVIIIKGRVLAVNEGSKILSGSGSFIGIADLFAGHFLCTYIAFDDITFYCFPVSQRENIAGIFTANRDYRGVMTASLLKYLNEAEKIYNDFQMGTDQFYDFMKTTYTLYTDTGRRLGYPVNTLETIENLQPYESSYEVDLKKLLYYKECSKISLEVWKSFCAAGDALTMYLVEDISGLIEKLILECASMAAYLSGAFEGLMSSREECLFKSLAALAVTIHQAEGSNEEIIQVIDDTVDQINRTENLFQEKAAGKLLVDRKRMEEIYHTLLFGANTAGEQVEDHFRYPKEAVEEMERELKHSLRTILDFTGMEETQKEDFQEKITDYINLKDRYSIEDRARILRKTISEQFYSIYEQAFLIALDRQEIPRAVELFLKYAYMDERLLTKDQLKALYFLEEDLDAKEGPCHVYNIKDWLTEIYLGRKEPSKNEFDLDYKDMLREKRKRGEITEAREKELMSDQPYKLNYEIHNMFRYNHRLVNGQVSTFMPILWSGVLIRNISDSYVTAERVNAAIKELMDIDYSVFHREVLYVNNEAGITKEYTMKQVFPDIVLLPTGGFNGIMWQEITGKRRSGEGRFFLPSFTEQSLRDMLIKVFGRFRWELCRSIQGSAWNNIREKSLTSEYSDYLQFFRKNHDLSEDARERIKSQIQKGKNNYREVFVLDYEAWIKGEAGGAVRLNKVAREILATYCPFSRPIREKLMGQPLFGDAMARFTKNSLKKAKDLEIRYRTLQKDGIKITEEMADTLTFYRNL